MNQTTNTDRLWMLFAATSALHFLSSNEADNDLWVHLLLGKRILASGAIPRIDDLSFTAAGLPWVDHEWLAQVVFSLIYGTLGATGLWLTKVAAGFATAGLVWRSIARTNGPLPLRAFVIVLVLAALSRGFSMRPQIFTYFFVAALLHWLDSQEDRPPVLSIAIPVVALWLCAWANLHGAFIVGMGMIGLWSVSPPWNPRPTRFVLPAVALLAACFNPYGPYLFTYIWGELSVPHPLTEWQAPALGDPAQAPFWIILIATTLTLPLTRLLRVAPWRAVLLVGTAYLAVRHQRHIPLFALCAAAPLTDQITNLVANRPQLAISEAAQRLIGAAVAVMALLQLGLFAQRIVDDRADIVFEAEEYPVNAVRFAKKNNLSGSLALPLDWGGYTLWHLSPQIQVSMDGRFATVYPPDVVEENFAFFEGRNSDLLTQRSPDYVMTLGNVIMPAFEANGYAPIFRDHTAVLYGRQPPAPVAPTAGRRGRVPFP